MDGDTAVIGAYGDDDNDTDSGSVYVFTKPAGGWTTGTEADKLTASDGAAGDGFGISVAVDGDTAVIGAYGDDDNDTDSGSVYVFTKPAGGWTTGTEADKLTASDGAAGDGFGISVAVDGINAVVGAYGNDDNGADSGSVYILDVPK